MTDADAVQTLVEETVARSGTLDAVVNAAGIVGFRRVADAPEDDWVAVLDVHLGGYLTVLAAALPRMAAAGYGRIVGVTSGVGLARTSVDGPAYGCAKRRAAGGLGRRRDPRRADSVRMTCDGVREVYASEPGSGEISRDWLRRSRNHPRRSGIIRDDLGSSGISRDRPRASAPGAG